MDGFCPYVWQLTKTALWRAFSRARAWLFIVVSLAIPTAKYCGLITGMSDALAFGVTISALVGGFAFEWALAAYDLHREQDAKIHDLTPPPEGNRRALTATVYREVLESAVEMLQKGTVGCRDGKDSEAWIPVYEDWLQGAKGRIAREVGQNQSTAVFLIGNSIRGLEQVNGHTSEATRRLTFLNHHIGQLKEALKQSLRD
jgi:hypothetical protein